jgi:hypothetical protein
MMTTWNKYIFCIVGFVGTTMCVGAADDAWTWLYQKQFSQAELEAHAHQKTVTFIRDVVPAYTQLVFSWNALRPERGFFSFWVQSRDQATKKWGVWQKMIDWGAGVQRSYMGDKHDGSQYIHVRLEMDSGSYADAFRIKIVPHEGSSLALLKSIFVCISDFTKFRSENPAQGEHLTSVIVPNVPKKSQFSLDHERNFALCSPTSCSMLLGYLCGQPIDPISFAYQSYDSGLNAYGSWPFNMAHAFERCGGNFYFTTMRFNAFSHLHQRLQQGIPVVVSVRGVLVGAPKVYHSGHLLVVVGFDAQKQQVLCHDPAFKADEDIFQAYALHHFLPAWERSHRLGYLAEPVSRV